MNEHVRERIKQLKIQACRLASENASADEYENYADQKFAELIVNEVFKTIAEERFEIYEPVVQSVKQKFGVNQ